MSSKNKTDIQQDQASNHPSIKHADAHFLEGLTEAERVIEKKLRRKVDLLVMPTIMVVYLLNWIDR